MFPAWPAAHGGALRAASLLSNLVRRNKSHEVVLVHPSPECENSIDQHPEKRCTQVRVPVQDCLYAVCELPVNPQVTSTFDLAVAFAGQRIDSLHRTVQTWSEWADLVLCFQPYLFPFVEDVAKPIVIDMMDVELDVKQVSLNAGDKTRPILEELAALEGSALRRADRIWTMSRSDSARIETLYGLDGSRVQLIGNGTTPAVSCRPGSRARMDARRELKLDPYRPMALYFSSAHPPNVDTSRVIVRRLAPFLPSVSFVIAGPLCWILEHEPMTENVLLRHEIQPDERPLLYRAADVGLNPVCRVLPGSDIKVLDYLGHGVPVVATALGARGHDLVEGYHYYPMDDDFAGAVRHVLDDDVLANHLAHYGLERARQLDWANLAAVAESSILEVIENRGLTPRTHGSCPGTWNGRSPLEPSPQENARLALAEFRQSAPIVASAPCELCIDLTNDCKLRCVHCYRSYTGHEAVYLAPKAMHRIPNRFYRLARQIELSGIGEPMLHPRWDEILEWIAGKSSARLTFNTSLTLVTEERLRRMVELGAGVAVSIDAARPDTFERIRRGASHEAVFGALKRLSRLGREIANPRFFLRIKWTLMKPNVAELSEFVDLAAGMGISEIHVQPLAPHHPSLKEWCCSGEDQETSDFLLRAFDRGTALGVAIPMHGHLLVNDALRTASADNARSTRLLAEDLWHHHWPGGDGCSYPWTQINIDAAGNVVACCFSDAHMGNLLNEDLELIWNNFRMARLRAEVNEDRCSKYCVQSPSGGVCCPRIQWLRRQDGQTHFLQE